ncbi:MAG: MBL fold metallo-hydrolase, partial [Proteobacteria bacterium]|nr:MBL fold metallo-hydrolase [Pseudomonadota bacterium]
MSTQITFLGHGTFQVQSAGKSILIDPFFTGNPAASTTADAVEADFIVVTHGHGDHVGDTVEIAKRTGALVIANFEIVEWFRKQGVEKLEAQHIGGAQQYDFGELKL